jgi:hypothetical protein
VQLRRDRLENTPDAEVDRPCEDADDERDKQKGNGGARPDGT